MMEHLIHLTAPLNSFFSCPGKYAIPILIGILMIIPAIQAGPAANNSTTIIGTPVENPIADTRPSVTNEDLMPSPPLRITISGKITTPDGLPVDGATVRTEFFVTSDTQSVTVKSEADGSYRINNALGYNQKMSVEKEGYTPITRDMTFNKNLNTLDFTLQPTTQPSPGFTGLLCIAALFGSLLIVVPRKARRC